MPYNISLENLPAGICVSAARGGETVSLQYKGVATSEDGELLIRYLGFADDLIEKVNASGGGFRPSQIDNLLAIFSTDRTATVYINELELITTCRPARSVKKGEALFKDDIIDITDARFVGAEVADDAGVFMICSSRWRKGAFFDFGPINQSEPLLRDYDLWKVLGQIVSRLFFQERFAISNQDWGKLFSVRWFPFAGLSNKSIESLLGHVRAGWGVQDLLPDLKNDVSRKLDFFIEIWKSKPVFKSHIELLGRAIERFRADDYVSCSAILYPRIEGLLRSHHIASSPSSSRNQLKLTESAIASISDNPYSLLLPVRFQEYLQSCFFAPFDENSSEIPFSRNSVGHGVASHEDFNLESALIGLLVCGQLNYCIPGAENE